RLRLDGCGQGGRHADDPACALSGRIPFCQRRCGQGELRVEVLDEKREVIEPFTRARCIPIRQDKTFQAVTWTKGTDVARLAGERVRFRFYLTSGRLFAFWVSAAKSGASHGYLAAGGPTFTGPTDTVGQT